MIATINAPGVLEGIAKGLSNALSYGVDSRKTLYQLHGFVPKLSRGKLHGLTSSCICIGLIYFGYFSVYNRMLQTSYSMFSGQVAALATSSVRLPIYNGIRMMQSGKASSIYQGCMQLYKSSVPFRMGNMYKGYVVSLMEDMIEMDVKNRLYNKFRNDRKHVSYNVAVGTVSSASAAYITTPFDNIKLQMCVANKDKSSWKVIQQNGLQALIRGSRMRVTSNVIKNSSFFLILEVLRRVVATKPKHIP
jgi:hypothetical protein